MANLLPLLPATAQAMVTSQGAQLVAAAESHQVFSPEECSRIVAMRNQLGWDSARVEARTKPTERQVKYLRVLGYDGDVPSTKSEASRLIDELKKEVEE